MILVLSGEGKSDLGACINQHGQCAGESFEPGPLVFIIDQILEEVRGYSVLDSTPNGYFFISERGLGELNECRKHDHKRVTLPGKNKGKETGYFYINAWMLAEEAMNISKRESDGDVIAILFRDADGTRSTQSGLWDKKYQSIKDGFLRGKLGLRGVPMVPRPKSEAWILCALREPPYLHCGNLEEWSGNDNSPNSLKAELHRVTGGKSSGEEIRRWIEENKYNHVLVAQQMPSFQVFKEDLLRAINQPNLNSN